MKTLITLALAGLFATNAHALYVDFGDDPPDMGGGGFQVQNGAPVEITGTRTTDIFDPERFRLVNQQQYPIPRDPMGDNTPGLPPIAPPKDQDEAQKRKDQCTQTCSVAFQIANAANLDVLYQFRTSPSISLMPIGAAIGIGIVSTITFGPFLGTIPGSSAGWYWGVNVRDTEIKNEEMRLAAQAGKDYTDCMKQKCKAWFLLLGMPLPLARRRKEAPVAA
jgi:hypothetical protein